MRCLMISYKQYLSWGIQQLLQTVQISCNTDHKAALQREFTSRINGLLQILKRNQVNSKLKIKRRSEGPE